MPRASKHSSEKIPSVGASVLVRRIWERVQAHDVFGRAAQLAYFFLFSICPLLIVLTSLLGMVSGGEQIRGELLQYFQTALPRSAYQLVSSTLSEIMHASARGKLSIGLLFTIASASSGMVAIMQGLNTAYEVRDARGGCGDGSWRLY